MSDVVRVDRHTITVDGHRVRATPDQEERIRAMNPDALRRFVQIMGGGDDG